MKSAVFTLFEGDYHYGVAALANSLYKNGFNGTIWVGYRGELPIWATPTVDAFEYQEYKLSDNCVIRFLPVKTDLHLTNYKPFFISDVLSGHEGEYHSIFYIDPDIVIKCHWSFFLNWVENGIAVCEQVIWGNMKSSHPIRLQWKKFAQKKGYAGFRDLNSYFNAGYIGLKSSDSDFLEIWKDVLLFMKDDGINLSRLQTEHPTQLFFAQDQDALNLSLMITTKELSVVGPDGMDFMPGGFLMSHAAGQTKSWRKNFLLETLLRGFSPSLADSNYLKNVEFPIKLYSKQQLSIKKINIYLARLISRIL